MQKYSKSAEYIYKLKKREKASNPMRKMSFKGYFGNLYLLGLQLLFMLFVYTLLRIGFYEFNKSLFPDVSTGEFLMMLKGGVKFDLAALLYINVLYILWVAAPHPFKYTKEGHTISAILFVGSNAIGIALNLIDYVYYPFTLKRTTGTVFKQFSNESNLFRLVLEFLGNYWYMVLVFVGIIFALAIYVRCLQLEKPKFNWRFYFIQSLSFLLIVFLFVGGVRGGWAHSTRPITINNAGDYVSSPELISVVVNTPFSILRTLKAQELQEKDFFSEEELAEIYPVIHYPDSGAQFKDLNVVVLIMESFGRESVGALNTDLDDGNYRGYTPFLDSLIGESYAFKYGFANGRKSIDALPSIITGVPSIGEPYVLSIYASNKTTSMAELLKKKGYETAFFHGAPNGSMGFSAYTKLAGIEKYYGKNEYNDDRDYDGIWGIWDEPFMQFMADEIGHLTPPFFAGFFSVSSHHPFRVPEEYKGVFPKGELPIHEPLGYSDNALRNFFEKASKMPWYENTLFVISADHATVNHKAEYQNEPGAYAIPILFYYPGGELKGMDVEKPVQQIDILPTVMSFLQYDQPYFSFGFNALDKERENFAVSNNGDHYNYFSDNYYMIHNGNRPLAIYDLQEDKFLKNNLLPLGFDRIGEFDKKMKAFIQQYNNRLIHNDLLAK